MERLATIRKQHARAAVVPNMADYEIERARFGWNDARQGLAGLPDHRELHTVEASR